MCRILYISYCSSVSPCKNTSYVTWREGDFRQEDFQHQWQWTACWEMYATSLTVFIYNMSAKRSSPSYLSWSYLLKFIIKGLIVSSPKSCQRNPAWRKSAPPHPSSYCTTHANFYEITVKYRHTRTEAVAWNFWSDCRWNCKLSGLVHWRVIGISPWRSYRD